MNSKRPDPIAAKLSPNLSKLPRFAFTDRAPQSREEEEDRNIAFRVETMKDLNLEAGYRFKLKR